MTLEKFFSKINAFDRAELKPDGKERSKLTRIYFLLSAKAPSLFTPDRIDMINRVLLSRDTLQLTDIQIDRIEREIRIALGEDKPLQFPELSFVGEELKKDSAPETAKYFFERGMELGMLKGALTDPVRKKAKENMRSRIKSTKKRSYWAPNYPRITELIVEYLDGKIKNQEALRQRIGSSVDRRGLKPTPSTLAKWISNYRAHGDIAQNISR